MYNPKLQAGIAIAGGVIYSAGIAGVLTGTTYLLTPPTLKAAATFWGCYGATNISTYWLGREVTKISSGIGKSCVFAISSIASTFFTQKLVSVFGVAISLKASFVITACVLGIFSISAIISFLYDKRIRINTTKAEV